MGKVYYGVACDTVPGNYTTWSLASDQTDGFSGACNAGFDELKSCVEFIVAIGSHSEDSIKVHVLPSTNTDIDLTSVKHVSVDMVIEPQVLVPDNRTELMRNVSVQLVSMETSLTLIPTIIQQHESPKQDNEGLKNIF
ncbi:hypothetical protein LSH36_6g05048 [Paralvinella palmiformis]|uniref:Ribonuclease H1 N-terminal domain-containing protein n=1 Tax=Paralvinella palmiformis TaxID=53620 RepID=A0AAD9KFL4_9ANNE|nr:hypothetical protein LSH36_6g05048 [Paralvinella palmiformis]